MSPDSAQREVERRLRDVGGRLGSPPVAVDELLTLLEDVETWLSRVEQSPPESMSSALRPTMTALVKKELLGHTDNDVRVAVASCLSEVTRITAPDAPYDDDVMKEVFAGMVDAFDKLDDVDSKSFVRRVSILETVAKVRSCVVMLDLECDDLILEMFRHFFKTVSSKHPENVIASMETILKLVIEESEDVHPQLASCLLQNVKKEEKETLSPSFGLAEKVIGLCHEKLKPVFIELLQGTPLNEYSKVVTSVCQDSSDARRDSDVDASGKDMADDSKMSERTVSNEPPQASSKLEQDVSCPGQHSTSPNSTPTTAMSNGVAPVDNDKSLVRPDSPKQKPEQPDDEQANNTDQLRSDNKDVPKSPTAKPEESSDLNLKKSHDPNSSTKSEATELTKVGIDEEALAASGEPPTDTKDDHNNQLLEASNGSGNDISIPADSTPDVVKPKRSCRPALKSPEKKAVSVGKSEGSDLDSKKADVGNDSAGKPIRRPGKVDVKSSTGKTGEGESLKKQQQAGLKQQKEEALSDEDTSEDLSLKEMVSPKSSTKVPGKTKGQLRESGGSKRKRGQDAEETPQAKRSNGLDGNLVGARIKVWWPVDKMFYNGVVDSFNVASKRHKVVYDDGDVEVLLLKNEKWEFISEEQDNSPDAAAQASRGRKGRRSLGRQVKAGKTETPKSDGGDLPKKGRSKGVRAGNGMSNDDSPVILSKLKGKNMSKDVKETPKATDSLKKEGGKLTRDSISRSTGKTKDDISNASNKDDTSNSGRRSKDGSSRSANKSKDEQKNSKDETKSSEVTPRAVQKSKTGDGFKTNGVSNKRKLKEKEGETSEKEERGSSKSSTGMKRRRK